MTMVRGCGVFRQAAGVLLASTLLAWSVAQAAPEAVAQAEGPQWIDLQGGGLAGFGYVVLVGCWISPPRDFPPPVVTCSLPPFGTPGLQATITAVVLVDAARRLPGGRANDLRLGGWSAGGPIAH